MIMNRVKRLLDFFEASVIVEIGCSFGFGRRMLRFTDVAARKVTISKTSGRDFGGIDCSLD